MKRLLACLSVGFLVGGCAVISTPSGGPKDDTPPQVVSALLDTAHHRIALQFDEYVTLTNAPWLLNPGGIVVQPKIRGRWVIIEYPDSLRPVGGWVVSSSGGVQDVTEGNRLAELHRWLPLDTTSLPDSGELWVDLRQFGGSEIPESGRVELHTSQGVFALPATDGAVHFRFLPPGRWPLLAYDDQNLNRRFDANEPRFFDSVTISDSMPTRLTAWLGKPSFFRVGGIDAVHSSVWRIRLEGPIPTLRWESELPIGRWQAGRVGRSVWVWVDTGIAPPLRIRLAWTGGDTTLLLPPRSDKAPPSLFQQMGWRVDSPSTLTAVSFYPGARRVVTSQQADGDIPCDSFSDTFPQVQWKAHHFLWSTTTSISGGLTCWRFPSDAFQGNPPTVPSCHCTSIPSPPSTVHFRWKGGEPSRRYRLVVSDGQMFHVEHSFIPPSLTLYLLPGTYQAWLYEDTAPPNQWYDGGIPFQQSAEKVVAYQTFRLSSSFKEVSITLEPLFHRPSNSRK